MIRNLPTRLIFIAIIAALAIWVDVSNTLLIPNPFGNNFLLERNVAPRLGLDLQGGLQVLLEVDLPESTPVDRNELEVARTITENRTNALGVAENVLQVAGDRRIVGEFPGTDNAAEILKILQQTGLLEFVDTGTTSLPAGTRIETTFGNPDAVADGVTVFQTIMTGSDLESVNVSSGTLGGYQINFTLKPAGAEIFAKHTSQNVGRYLTIVLDKVVISSPVIEGAITGGSGTIQGTFTYEEANALAVQLRYGSLPIPLKIVETRIIGPTLGEDSLQRSMVAGVIGIIIVILFMAIYYRVPGIVADVSIIFYALIAFAIFKLIGVTLTLPGIAGFMLSTGSALDANILVFERFKEELRNGKTLKQAFDLSWSRAWPSIRDSNIAALITAGILYWFGSTFGATIVKGFSLTLALGVVISLFSALYITRTFLAAVLDAFKPSNYERWFGL